MDVIKILPHHAMRYFEVFYLGKEPENALSWYDNEGMKRNGIEALNKVISNPNQLVQIVDTYDEWCRMCPKNKQGNNYQNDPDDTCTDYDTPNPDTHQIEVLGLESIAEGKIVTATELKDLMKPTYDKFMSQPSIDKFGKKTELHMHFGSNIDFHIQNYLFS